MLKVLLIEDEDGAATILRQRLSKVASEVEIARTWGEAVEKIRTNPDLVTFDATLPDSRIEDATERISFIQAALPNTPVIIISGASSKEIEDICERTKVTAIQKDQAFSGKPLFERIKAAFEGRTGYEENVKLLEQFIGGLK